MEDFLCYIFEHFDVAVWSSVTRTNIGDLVEFAFGVLASQLKFVFYQSRCEKIAIPGQEKPLFLKNLSEVWKSFPQYGPENTLLIDDSDEKSRNNPPRCHFNPGTWKREMLDDTALLPGGIAREVLGQRLPGR